MSKPNFYYFDSLPWIPFKVLCIWYDAGFTQKRRNAREVTQSSSGDVVLFGLINQKYVIILKSNREMD